MYIATIPNRKSPPAILLRESYRDGGAVKNRTLANLSSLKPEQIQAISLILKGEHLVTPEKAFQIERSLPHGHVAAVLGLLRDCGLEHVLGSKPSRSRDLVAAMIVARIIHPRSKLATARGLREETASDSLAKVLSLGDVSSDELYNAMDWLVQRQNKIQDALAAKHLQEGALVLYDASSSYFEGRRCELAKHGYSRDHRGDRLQIVYGLMCDSSGRPVAVEVFEGNTADPGTVASQVRRLRERFGLTRMIIVADRGMLTSARLREDLSEHEEIAWITALRAPAIQDLAREGHVTRSLFDERDLFEFTSSDYPGERLVACRNPLLAEERARTREELLQATEKELKLIAAAVQREQNPLTGRENIARRLGRVEGKYKVAKHFVIGITDTTFTYARNAERIRQEAALDGIYVLRTKVPEAEARSEKVVEYYKSLSRVERAFRSMKSVDLKIRPIHHWMTNRVRAHVFLCMLAYYVEWHLRQKLRPLLHDDEDHEGAAAERKSIVAPAKRSPSARQKVKKQRTEDDYPVHSFRTLLADLATLTWNQVNCGDPATSFQLYSSPTRLQSKAFELLGVSPTPR